MSRPTRELAEVFRRYGDAYRQQAGAACSTAQRRVMAAIETCRTAARGGHVELCPGERLPGRRLITGVACPRERQAIGDRSNASYPLNKGGKIFAVDISQALLDIARQRVCNTTTTLLCHLNNAPARGEWRACNARTIWAIPENGVTREVPPHACRPLGDHPNGET